MSGPTPQLSLVTPVYNGEAYIKSSVEAMIAALERLGSPFEVIVVSDGCTDATADQVAQIEDPRVRLVVYPDNRGKGSAIVSGVAAARGRLVAWLDSDLDIAPETIVDAARRLDRAELDAVIGSKRHPQSRVCYPMIRRVYSWAFQMLVRILFRVNVRDTQVGAKVFRREMLETVCPLLLVKRYAFDLEVLAVGAEFGFDRIAEAPIELSYRFTGSGINSASVWRMFIDTLAIAYRIHLRHWYARQFASQQRARLDVSRIATTELRAEVVEPSGKLVDSVRFDHTDVNRLEETRPSS